MEDVNIQNPSTDIAKLSVVETKQTNLDHKCEPCQSRGNPEILASFYCKDCNEKYCDVCTTSHRTQKATKGHNIIDVRLADYINPAKPCDPCQYQQRTSKAAFACMECEEFLCNGCKTSHLSQRQNKNHRMLPIDEDLFCEPCKESDKKVPAAGFCENCEEPELLCLVCADQHKAMKMTRHHKIIFETAVFVLRHASIKKEEAASLTDDKTLRCEPCNYKGVDTQAAKYCKDCNESMCQTCSTKHTSMKRFADHVQDEIQNLLKPVAIVMMCEPCKFHKRERDATHRCEECDEYLCQSCKDVHVLPKRNRTHTLTEVGLLNNETICDSCPGQASVYCKDCDVPMCNMCAEDHKAMKMTRDHDLSNDLTKYVLRSTAGASYQTVEQEQFRHSVSKHVTEAQAIKETDYHELCEPCGYDGKNESTANHYCENCEEKMCDICIEFHDVQPEYKDHVVSQISNEKLWCDLCALFARKNPAVCYCKDCCEPKPLCNDCAKKHQAMKKTREHTISADLEVFRKRITHKKPHVKSMIKTKGENSLQATEKNTVDDDIGQPYASECKSDEIVLQWRESRRLSDNENYQIMFKEHPSGKWKSYSTKQACKLPKVTITGLKPNTCYVFKVRILDDSSGEEGPYTMESDIITTKPSPALHILHNSEKIEHGPPCVYRLPIKENYSARNEKEKTRKFFLGKPEKNFGERDRTIMIVGATGCGKSTLVNSMANYIMGVTWEDPFRFTLINLEACEKEKQDNQAFSQTEWVTCYSINTSVSDRIDYNINLIDTPGFGDTRGLDQDNIIINQIRQLFTAKGEPGVDTLDAVCFILKAPDARLTATQRYIFESILALFGNDIKDNICTLVTFADGQRPPVLAGIQAIDGVPLPYDTYFTFNNSALFVDNTQGSQNNMSSFFWDMGIQSCKTFFDHVTNLQTRSLSLTTEVLQKRQKLETTIRNLQQEIDVGLSRINTIEKEIEIFTQNAQAILDNKDFEYEMEEDYQEKIDLEGKGQYTTNCLNCNYTCHENCAYANDKDKARCCAMNSEGKCNQCPNSCHWTTHLNTPYIIKWSQRKVKKRYDEMKKKYEEATQKSLSQEQVLEQMAEDVALNEGQIQIMMEVISKLNNRLKEIALRPDPLSTVQYIDLMIQSEKRESKTGFEDRIDALEKCKKRATYGESVQIFQDRIKNTRKSIVPTEIADEILKDENGSVASRIKAFFKGGAKAVGELFAPKYHQQNKPK